MTLHSAGNKLPTETIQQWQARIGQTPVAQQPMTQTGYPTISLQPGSKNTAEVKKLQDYLVSQGLMTQAQVDTGYGTYGLKTKVAVTQWQKSKGIQAGADFGYWGPKSIAAASQSVPYSSQNLGVTPPPVISTFAKTTTPTPVAPSKKVIGQYKGVDVTEGTQKEVNTQVQAIDTGQLPIEPPVEPDVESDVEPDDTGKPAFDTGDPTLNAILAGITKLLTDAEAQGKKINPDIDLASLAKSALDEAIKTVDPYYAGQIKSVRGDLEQGITSLAKEYELAKEERAAQYKQTLGIQQESEAGRGTIFSGGRIQREQELGAGAARSFESLATQTAESAMRAGRETERTIGSLGITGYQMPTISQYGVSPTSQLTPTSRTLWSPTGGITGSLERERDVIREQTRRELLKKKQEESLWT